MRKKLEAILIIVCLLVGGVWMINHMSQRGEGHSVSHPDSIRYIQTLAHTELLDADGNVIGTIGEYQTFSVNSVSNYQLLRLSDLPFYLDPNQVETIETWAVKELPGQEPMALDLSRYLAFEQMIAEGSTVNFYHLDRTPAFSIDAVDTDIQIYMQDDDHFYVSYLDTHFLVAREDVALIDNPNSLPETTAIPVLMYHFFCNPADGVECRNNNWLERDHFAEHMQYLQNNDFTTLMMIDVERFLNRDVRLPEQSVVITIDDGHPTVFEYAYPILIETDQIATVFAITHFNRDWETLLLSDHLELHSHTHDMHRGHCDTGLGGIMQCIDFDEGVADLNLSRSILNDTTVFAYPFGDFNDHTRTMLEETDFTLAFTTRNGLITRDLDPLLLPRVRVSTETHLPQFVYLVNQR